MTIGFLGAAKERKGFDLIPSILSNLPSTLSYKAIVQKANYSWKLYSETLKKLQENPNVKLLSGSISLEVLLENISFCDVLILPYDKDSYSINASGLLYHACDFEIPVISFRGVGFSKEIENYNLGFLIDSIEELKNFDWSFKNKKFGFSVYNELRQSRTINLLFGNN